MALFEWIELETLNGEIAHSQTRLAAARSTRNHGLVKLLEREIGEAEVRRQRLLAHINRTLADSPDSRAPAASPIGAVPAEKAQPQQQRDGPAERIVPNFVAPDPAPGADTKEGVAVVWNQVTPADIERLKQELVVRRAEMLARHAEELKTLEGDQAEIDAFEQAIDAFARKFNISGAAVLQLEEGRASRIQARG